MHGLRKANKKNPQTACIAYAGGGKATAMLATAFRALFTLAKAAHELSMPPDIPSCLWVFLYLG